MRVASLCKFTLVALAVGVLGAQEKPAKPTKAEKKTTVDYVRDIRPLLQKNCYSCHGAEEQEGGLRLDVKALAFAGGDKGKAFIPGKSGASKLIQLVMGKDPDLGIMPPDGEGTPLTKQQIALLRTWIDEGANWPDGADAKLAASKHWSFQPIRRHDPPKVKDTAWVRNPIDAFILARLEAEKIRPSPAAPKEMLIRRLYLDLLGLPPSPQEVEQFVNDDDAKAYEKVVGLVLRSPHYGERWGRHWLDLARYADSDGYEKDRPRPHAWRYRHWVIEALNNDMPFDQFTIQQIAGDLLPDAPLSARVATGFHRNTLHNTEGGTDKEEDRVKKTVDRTNTFSTIWLGLTVGCAQCHTHKYDPITQREYYSLYSFFNNIDESDISAPLREQQRSYDASKKKFDQAHAAIKKQVDAYRRDKLPTAAARWATEGKFRGTAWTALKPTTISSAKGAELKVDKDHSVLAGGKNELSDVYTVEAATAGMLTAIRLEVLTDKSLPKNGPGRADNGNFVLTTFSAKLRRGDGEAVALDFAKVNADFAQNEWAAALAINKSAEDGWAVSPQIGKRHVAVFLLKEPIDASDGQLTITLDQTYNRTAPHNIGRFRLSVTGAEKPELEGSPQALIDALAAAADKRSPAQLKLIENHYAKLDPALAQLEEAVAAHAKKAPKPPGTKAQTTVERGQPRETRIHVRGNFLTKGDLVSISTPAILPAAKARGKRLDRLDLARSLMSEENPLTARVTVNRIWQRYFGVGIVSTSDDFGTQGEPPSHPKLLDWLASELRTHKWSLKHVHRLIVTSATYRQTSAMREDLAEIDPLNRLLARQARRRVEGEIVRDLALAVSGQLDRKIGGPSVRPPQPSEYSSLTYANSAKWNVSSGGDRFRRGLYTFFQRTSPYPMLMTFDSPDSNECTAQRNTSNTPLQALTLWNDVVFFECAQALGRRILREAPKSDDAARARCEYAFQLCLSRKPGPDEMETLLQVYQSQLSIGEKSPEIAKKICGAAPLPKGADHAQAAACVILGRVLINLDEFVSKE